MLYTNLKYVSKRNITLGLLILAFLVFFFGSCAHAENEQVLIVSNANYVDTGYQLQENHKPNEVLNTKIDVLQAINYNVKQMKSDFVLTIRDFSQEKLPIDLGELERYFISKISISPGNFGATTNVSFHVEYNDAGRALANMLHGRELEKNDKKAIAITKEATKLATALSDKSVYEKIVYLHDYIVENTKVVSEETIDSKSAYGVLIKNIGSANGEGYSETLQLMFELLNIENCVVWSKTNNIKNDTARYHLFNKVKLGEDWYNIDTTVDDPLPDDSEVIRRGYLLVTDAVVAQRYSWENLRYPSATVEKNWHMRDGLVVTSQKELENFVADAIEKRYNYIAMWIPNYSPKNYNLGLIRQSGNIGKCTIVPAINNTNDVIQTEMIVKLAYN